MIPSDCERPEEGFPDGAPDYEGVMYGVYYAAWQVQPLGSMWAYTVRAYTWDSRTGELFLHPVPDHRWAPGKRQEYFMVQRPSKIHALCWSTYKHEIYSEPEELPIREVHCDDVNVLIREVKKRKARMAERLKAARFFKKLPEQVTSADLSALRRANYL